ncbi:MAG: hypothetical protein MNPFHGCM_01910 [Gemmatimonadaceae bacterium]|nr:hypothetical protein [Gemmatimonadaceae bacterium]
MTARRASISLLWLAVVAASTASAQSTGTLIGTVLDDSTEIMLADAEVSIPGLNLMARTNARGEFVITGIGAGSYAVIARRIGYQPWTGSLPFNGADTVRYQFSLRRVVQSLPGVAVTGTNDVPAAAKLSQFERRRRSGAGRFLTAVDFERINNRLTGDALSSRFPGIRMMKDAARPMAAYVAGSRGVNSIEGLPGRGPPKACLLQVWLDGARVFSGLPGEPPFDINSVQSEQIAAVELYAGSASLPTELRSGNAACGAILVWTK